jgi:short-subunit dehydrogenase
MRDIIMKKTVLITGAGSGFGRGTAIELAKRGFSVIAGVQISPQKSDLIKAAEIFNVELEVIVLDITNKSDREAAFDYDIDILVNNAGILEAGPVAEIPLDRVKSNFETNVFGTLSMIQGFAPQMVKKGKGKIVTVTSIAGLVTMPFGAIYSSTKQALEAIVEGLSIELHGTGVDVCTVNPGFYNTGFNDRGAETMGRWFDPSNSLSPAELLAPLEGLLDDQLDPQEQIDDLVKIIEEERSKFRNVCPPAIVPWAKAVESRSWSALSNEQVWVEPSET